MARGLLLLALLPRCASNAGASDETIFTPNPRLEFPAAKTLGFVANRYSDTVSVLDLDDFITLGSVPIGRDPVDIDGPVHVVLDEQRSSAYVLLSYPFSATSPHVVANGAPRRSGYVRELSLADLRPLRELRVEPRAGDLAFAPELALLAVSHFDQDLALSVEVEARRANVAWATPPWPEDIEGMRKLPACATPAGMVVGARGARLYVACTGEDALVVLDTDQGKVLSRVPAGSDTVNKPFSLTSDRSRTRLLLSNQVARKVVQFAAGDTPLQLVESEAFEGVPFNGAYVSEHELVVPLQNPSGAARVDAVSGKIVLQRAYSDDECENPSELSVLASGRLLLVCEGSHYQPGWVAELDPETLHVRSTLELGLYPDRLAVRAPLSGVDP